MADLYDSGLEEIVFDFESQTGDSENDAYDYDGESAPLTINGENDLIHSKFQISNYNLPTSQSALAIKERPSETTDWSIAEFKPMLAPTTTPYDTAQQFPELISATDVQHFIFNTEASPLAHIKTLYNDLVQNLRHFSNSSTELYLSRIGALINTLTPQTRPEVLYGLASTLHGICHDQSRRVCLQEIYTACTNVLHQLGVNIHDIPGNQLLTGQQTGSYSLMSHLIYNTLLPMEPSSVTEVCSTELIGYGLSYYNAFTRKTQNNMPNNGSLLLLDACQTFNELVNA